MDERSTTYRAAMRTAVALSTVAVGAAVIIDSVTDVSHTVLVLAAIVVGFVASMVVTERTAGSLPMQPDVVRANHGHRVTVLPAPHRVA
jgi:hypothetical protein